MSPLGQPKSTPKSYDSDSSALWRQRDEEIAEAATRNHVRRGLDKVLTLLTRLESLVPDRCRQERHDAQSRTVIGSTRAPFQLENLCLGFPLPLDTTLPASGQIL